MANPIRGEKEITLNGVKYATKLNLNSMMVMERKLERSTIKVLGQISQGDLPLQDMVTILQIALKGGNNDLSDADVKKLVWEHGVIASIGVVGEVLANALAGEEEDEGKPEAVNE